MVTEQQVIAIVPARAGSKGIPHKNLQPLAGRTLLQWTVDLAMSMPEFDRCIVSTDGAAIAREARRLGATVHDRPLRLATDTALVIDTVRDVLATDLALHATVVVLLQPTSPLRSIDDVRGCLRGLADGADSAATVTHASSHPDLAIRLEDGVVRPYHGDALPWAPRQRLPDAFQLTGSVYAARAAKMPAATRSMLFGRVHPVIVPRERSIDIDEPCELMMAAALLRQGIDAS